MAGPFELRLRELVEKYKAREDTVVKKVLTDLATAVVYRTPVGDPAYWAPSTPVPPGYVGGRARGTWVYTTGAPATGLGGTLDASGVATLGRITAAIPDKPAGEVHYLTNNIPHGPALERGHSRRQAPLGIVGITVNEFQNMVDLAVQQVNP